MNKISSAVSLSASSASVSFGNTFTLSGTLTGDGTGRSGVILKLYDGNTLVDNTVVTSSGGAFSKTITSASVGNHSYKIVYDGDSTHTNVDSSTVSVTVSKATPTISYTGDSPRTIVQGSTNYFSGVLSANGSGIAGATVELYEVGSQEPSATTTTGNDGSYNLLIPSNIIYDEFKYCAKYWGSDNYEMATSGWITVIVTDSSPVPDYIGLTGDKRILSKADSEQCLLTATVLDGNGDAVEGETVTFSIVGGSTIGTAVTDSNG